MSYRPPPFEKREGAVTNFYKPFMSFKFKSDFMAHQVKSKYFKNLSYIDLQPELGNRYINLVWRYRYSLHQKISMALPLLVTFRDSYGVTVTVTCNALHIPLHRYILVLLYLTN